MYVKENKKLIKTQKIIIFFSDFEDTTIFLSVTLQMYHD